MIFLTERKKSNEKFCSKKKSFDHQSYHEINK
jgi:hypothetical protein